MIRKITLLFALISISASYTFAQVGMGTIKGTVKDAESGEPLPFVNVVVLQGDNQKGGATTDFDGKFQINSVAAGEYNVQAKFVGYQTQQVSGFIVSADKIKFLDMELKPTSEMLEEVEIVDYEVPLIDKDGGASGATVTRDDISKMAARSATGVATSVGGVYSTETGDLSVRGSRQEATYYFIDGIKVRGSSSLPKSAIQEVQVVTGGLPANYGDATGGVISITTRGASRKFFGSGELVSSGFYVNGEDPDGYDGRVFGMDQYGYNLFEGMISGPLLFKKDSAGNKTDPVLGFFLSGNVTDQHDPRPVIGGTYRITKEARDELLQNPLRPTGLGAGSFANADFLDGDNFENVPYRMNARNTSASAAAKIDVNTGPNVNLSFGGSLNYSNGMAYSYTGSLFNFSNFGRNTSLDWRAYGRFTQRFQQGDDSNSKVKSAFYSIMVDYSKSYRSSYDPKHGDNLFNYGYVGRYEIERINTYEFQDLNGDETLDARVHNGFRDVEVQFTPSDVNSSLAAYTQQYFDLYDEVEGNYENLFQVQQGLGLRNGDLPRNVNNVWSALGSPYNAYSKSEFDQFRITGSGSVVIGDHSVSLGFEFEQRVDRSFSSGNRGPVGLWEVTRQLVNSHITELDENNFSYEYVGTYPQITYERLIASDNQSLIDRNTRINLGLNPDGNDFINIDALDPEFFSLDMFSPDELLNQGQNFFNWYGYDHTGEKVRGTTDINDYFSAQNDDGVAQRFIGAFQPIYGAVYIMDKFAFDDIIFNVGLRVDYFDANQPVLKDEYLLYEAYSAGEVTSLEGGGDGPTEIQHPSNIGDDYVVYVNDIENPTSINGYRDGDLWYNAQGELISDPRILRGPNGIAPYLTTPENVGSPTGDAFEQYTPQINLMPRISFSFPISDEANFFAHYDILTRRPTAGARFDPIDYQFLAARSNIIGNPNLRPEKTIDYELGFQQVLSRSSSLKISLFYREQRDQVQLRRIFEAYPSTYSSYSNWDFGTVKGTTITYDLRRTGNLRMTLAYTLQFADGTGSSSTSGINVVNSNQPNLRNIFPYNYDQRHAFNIVADYRYGQGKDYNGPETKNGFQILKNTGLNLQTNIGSGTPYSLQEFITPEALISGTNAGLKGSPNGSRKPWTYRLDMQLDRTFNLEYGKDEDKKKMAFLQVYVRVTNLFNNINVLNVYRSTGNADDDGYLEAAQYQSSIQSQLDEQAFRDQYALKVANPFNFGLPRTIRLGIKFDF